MVALLLSVLLPAASSPSLVDSPGMTVTFVVAADPSDNPGH
jgi:hypothetical protein